MPELPEVEIVRQSLDNKIKQKKVKKVLVRNRNLRTKIPLNFSRFLKGKKIIIDRNTCSIFFENIIKKKFKILKKEDPIYLLKSLKNKTEIKNMLQSHIFDGVALTKFIYWIDL